MNSIFSTNNKLLILLDFFKSHNSTPTSREPRHAIRVGAFLMSKAERLRLKRHLFCSVSHASTDLVSFTVRLCNYSAVTCGYFYQYFQDGTGYACFAFLSNKKSGARFVVLPLQKSALLLPFTGGGLLLLLVLPSRARLGMKRM